MASIQYSLPYLTEKGGRFHKSKEKRNYQFAEGLSTVYEKYLESHALRLKGTADFIIEHEEWLDVGEFKLSLPAPLPKGYVLQLSTLALLAEEEFGKPVKTLIFRSQESGKIEIPFTDEHRKEVIQVRDEIETMMDEGLPPSRTSHANRCNYCEFRKICP